MCSRNPGPLALRDGSPVIVETERGTVRARDVIVATNVPFGDGGSFDRRSLPAPLLPRRQPRRLPPLDGTFISVDEPMRSILAIDVDGASYVLTGGEGHRGAEAGDAAGRYRRLAAFSRDRLGAGETVFRWSTQDGMPVDGLPYVGRMPPTAAHVHVITGLRKWGLTNGTAGALILADTLCGRHNPWARGVRQPAVHPVPSAATVREDGTSRAAGCRNRPCRAAPGRGRRRRAGRRKAAVYADPAGQLRAVSAICTHLGCTVGFNAADVDVGLPLPRLPVFHRRRRHPGPGRRGTWRPGPYLGALTPGYLPAGSHARPGLGGVPARWRSQPGLRRSRSSSTTSRPKEKASNTRAGRAPRRPATGGIPGTRANNRAEGWAAPMTLRAVLDGSGSLRDGLNQAAGEKHVVHQADAEGPQAELSRPPHTRAPTRARRPYPYPGVNLRPRRAGEPGHAAVHGIEQKAAVPSRTTR